MSAGAPPQIKLVTGTDRRQFEQLLLLGGSLQRYCPGAVLHVCDFGLTEQQRNFVRERHLLLDKPASLGIYRHAWYYKGAMAHYVADLVCNAMVWIDADMIVLTDIRPLLESLYEEMKREGRLVAAASHDITLAEGLAAEPAPYGASLMRQHNLDVPLLNAGFYVCRSRVFLKRYADLTLSMPMEKLFEQNAFNLTVLENPGSLKALDRYRWNLFANDLYPLKVEVSPKGVTTFGPSGSAYILHATSNDRPRDIFRVLIPVLVEDRKVEIEVRMIRNPEELLEFQKQLTLETIKAEGSLLVRHRVWSAA